jgi:hypothetical protein
VIARRHPKQIDGEPVLAVFRPGLALPFVILTGIVVLFVIVIGIGEPHIGGFALAAWIVGAVPILLSRRTAYVVTSDSFMVRRFMGRTMKIPLRGIKRACIRPGQTNEDGPRLRVQLLVGGEMDLNVPDMEAIVYLLNKGAGRGLEPVNYRSQAETRR